MAEYRSKELTEIIHEHRKILQNIMTDEYMIAKANRVDPDSEYVQEQIFNRFDAKVTDQDIEILRAKFFDEIKNRDKNLPIYVDDTVKYLNNLKGNEDLIEAHFLQTMARDRKTGEVMVQTTDLRGYHNEKNIEDALNKRYDVIVPEFIRPNGERAKRSEIELIAIVNVTGLYDPKKTDERRRPIDTLGKDLIKYLEYAVESRIKTSEREMKKAIDWICGLRRIGDYPYDGIALRVITPNEALAFGSIGEQIYTIKDYIEKKYSRYGEVIIKNDKTKEENAQTKDEDGNPNVIKLNKGSYDRNNFRAVLLQMRKIYDSLKKQQDLFKKRQKKDLESNLLEYNPKGWEKDALLQYLQIKHYVPNAEYLVNKRTNKRDRAEIQIMTREMYEHYIGEFVGHTSNYLRKRDKDRKDYIEDPSKSDAAKDAQKRLERTMKNKKRNQARHIDNTIGDEESGEDILTEQHSMTSLVPLLEKKYHKAFVQDNILL